jgi:tyrosinase
MVEIQVFGPFAHGATAMMSRADLEFYGVNHFRPSFVAHIFFNDPAVSEENWTDVRPSRAGRFAIFGHQNCVGDEGHCDVPVSSRRFDDRPSHPLTRAFKRVIVTDALKRCLADGPNLTVTVVVACDPGTEMQFDGPLLDVRGLQLTTFG